MPSKLGIHAILPAETISLMKQVMEEGAHIPTVKAVEAIGWLKEVKDLDPTTQTVGRLMRGIDHDINVEGPPLDEDLEQVARDVMDNLLPLWEPHREYVDYWEIINEQDPPGPEGHRRLAELMMHCMDIADAEGYHLGLFSYSLGVPEWEEMEAVVETGVFQQAKAGGHMFALHEYAFPIDKWFGEPLPGRSPKPDRGPLSCRYRYWYEDFLIPRDEVVPLFITEFNVAQEMPLISSSEWIAQVAWYDARIREDYYVIGAHIFTLGGAGSWENFDFARHLPALRDHIIEIKDTEDPAWPDEEEEEEEPTPPDEEEEEKEKPEPSEPCAPREPYERHYLLLPPGAGWRWVAACRRYWERFNVTIGSSADDAGYGPGLKQRTVTAINPAQWPQDLEVFFQTHYPGILYDPIAVDSPEELELFLNRRVAIEERFG